ncbi:MAG: DNA-processing protein DprA [Thermoanaerobaculia bacterium]
MRAFHIACSLLPFMTPARLARAAAAWVPFERIATVPTAEIAQVLHLSESDARLLRAPLAVPEIARRVSEIVNDVVVSGDDDYPPILREIHDPPQVLHVRGDRAALSKPAIAIVGSRRASPYAINVARRLGREIASHGITVVSGLARGVDAAAQTAALDAGGLTVAILGTGIDRTYPREHHRLAERIATSGALVTEFAPGTPPLAQNFPVRNRIISGLTLGTIIVEATDQSGSLITARLAAEQNREVFCVPGPIFSPGSVGPHRLIQYGAKLLHDLDDLFDEIPSLRPEVAPRRRVEAAIPEPLRHAASLLRLDEPRHIDELAAAGKSEPGALSAALLELELLGIARSLPGGRYVKVE